MSKRKPNKVYRVQPTQSGPVVVLARSPKGALTYVRQHVGRLPFDAEAKEVSPDLAPQAINAPKAREVV